MRPSPDLPRCRLLMGGRTVIGADWCRRECDPFWRLYRNLDPGAEILHQRGRFALEPGRFYLVPAWTVFKGRCPGGIRHEVVHFQVVGLPAAWLRRHADAPLALAPGPDWGQVFDRLGTPLPSDLVLRLHGMLCQAVAQAVAGADQGPPDQGRAAAVIAPALALADQGAPLPATVAALAARCGVGPDHLARCFAIALGVTPARWLQGQRMAVAAEALAAGDEPIEAIAARLGYATRQHFGRVFRRITGTPPAAYRQRLGAISAPPSR